MSTDCLLYICIEYFIIVTYRIAQNFGDWQGKFWQIQHNWFVMYCIHGHVLKIWWENLAGLDKSAKFCAIRYSLTFPSGWHSSLCTQVFFDVLGTYRKARNFRGNKFSWISKNSLDL